PRLAEGLDLPSDLVEVELEALERRRLRRAVERVPQRLLDAVEVHEPRVRPGIAAVERIGGAVGIWMEAERVHQRPRAAARSVPGAERPQEAHGGRGDVVLRVRPGGYAST